MDHVPLSGYLLLRRFPNITLININININIDINININIKSLFFSSNKSIMNEGRNKLIEFGTIHNFSLQIMHSRNEVHRDIKPDNILIEQVNS